MKIDKYSDYLKIVTDDFIIILTYVSIFSSRAYAVDVSGRGVWSSERADAATAPRKGVWYFESLNASLDHVTEYLTVSECRELLDYLRKGSQNKKIEVS